MFFPEFLQVTGGKSILFLKRQVITPGLQDLRTTGLKLIVPETHRPKHSEPPGLCKGPGPTFVLTLCSGLVREATQANHASQASRVTSYIEHEITSLCPHAWLGYHSNTRSQACGLSSAFRALGRRNRNQLNQFLGQRTKFSSREDGGLEGGQEMADIQAGQ